MKQTDSLNKLCQIKDKNERACEIVKFFVSEYESHRGVFKNRINAEDHILENTTDKEKSLFLFYIIQLDYATKSQRLYKEAKKLWASGKKYYIPQIILKMSDIDLKSLLKSYLSPRYINEAVKRWNLNSKKLINEYNSNPINIFKLSNDAKKIENAIREFRGFGPKIGNFFFRAMVNTFDFKLKNINKVTQPVDRHDIRLSFEWGLIDSKDINKKNITKVKEIWQEACDNADKSWLIFDRAMWVWGSLLN